MTTMQGRSPIPASRGTTAGEAEEASRIIALVGASSPSMIESGAALARVMRADVRWVGARDALEGAHLTERLTTELARPEILLAVMTDGTAMEAVRGELISTTATPIVVLPERLPLHLTSVSRVLLPLDGSWEAAAAIAPTTALLAGAGVDLVVLHVFTPTNVPKFWDHLFYAREAWEPEFLARYCPEPGARLRLRRGTPGEQVLSVAAEEDADMIVLGWSQRLDPDRSATVRQSVTEAQIPVLLMPVPPKGSGRTVT